MMVTRRQWLANAAGVALATLTGGALHAAPREPVEMLVYKSPTCGCCDLWIDHVKAAGFRAVGRNVRDVTALKRELGLPLNLASCHTGLVGGYLVEGHVPADLIQRLLEERPAALGLAVPGMPMGSPGMEGPRKERYDVLLVGRDGSTRVYATR